jgi:hypothetical protein
MDKVTAVTDGTEAVMSNETEWQAIPGGTATAPAKVTFEVLEKQVERVQALPAKLVRLRVAVRKLARPLPDQITTDPEDLVARVLQDRVVAVVEGVYMGTGGFFVAANDATPPGLFGGGGLIGPAPGGSRLEASDLYAWLEAALKSGRFTAAQVQSFLEDRQAAKAVREGARLHVVGWVGGLPDVPAFLAALEKAGTVPGFAAAGGTEALDSYLELAMRPLPVLALFELVKTIKAPPAD